MIKSKKQLQELLERLYYLVADFETVLKRIERAGGIDTAPLSESIDMGVITAEKIKEQIREVEKSKEYQDEISER